jgi:hypothetical protein
LGDGEEVLQDIIMACKKIKKDKLSRLEIETLKNFQL